MCNVLHNAHSGTEGYAAGHCPYLDQCVFTHMDAGDILDWIKVEQNRRRRRGRMITRNRGRAETGK